MLDHSPKLEKCSPTYIKNQNNHFADKKNALLS
jgi:hypothetical protein